jgi:serine/threonine-protein kinase
VEDAMIGATLGPYRVLDKLGEGGMGVVYRARDTTLQRDVAVKVLPEHLGGDPDRVARFQREAEALAALNHPNIAHIYGLETGGASPAIVMELVEGPTLADRLRAGRIPLDEALAIARQIAEALEAAHERGIVHRDLKPANVKVTADGSVKVLDFGLAKVIEPIGEGFAEMANSPTLTARGTQMGVILGTAAYMAPEQAKGKPIDKRADLWAFGCVLYEMLTGRRAFEGDDVSDTLASVLKLAPDFDAVPASTPPSIVKLLRRCLEKDRKKRLADAADARLEIDEALAASDADSTQRLRAAPGGVPVRTTALIVVAALIAGGLLAGLAVWTRSSPLDPRPVRFIAVAEPFDVVGLAGNSNDLAIAPDGTKVVLTAPAGGQLAVRDLQTLGTTQLSSVGRMAYGPFISPDGAWVGFNDQSDGTIKRVSILGGPTVEIGPAGGGGVRGASWGEDDTIVFGTVSTSGLWRIPAGGGTPEEISTAAPGVSHAWPDILPGGRAVLFTILAQPVEQSQIALLDLETREHTVLISGGSYPRYVPTGHIVYGVDGALRAVGFDLRRRQVTTSPVPVVDGVLTKASGSADFAVAGNGSLVYLRGTAQGASRTLVWVDRSGREEPLAAPPRAYFYPRLSPDGTRVALDVRDEENDIWIWDLARETMTRLTFDPGLDRMPVWSPTGDRIAFSAQRDVGSNLYWTAANATGTAERLTDSENEQYTMSFTPDGEILFVEGRESFDLMAVPVQDTDRRPRALVESSYAEWNGEVSPNGRWLAYQSNESGRNEVYVRPFPDVEGGRWQVSTDGGTRPVWRRDGGELFYYFAGRVTAVPIESGSAFVPGTPTVLFEGDYAAPQIGRVFDVTADGQRFILIKDSEAVGGDEQRQVLAVLNWFPELQRLVPVR